MKIIIMGNGVVGVTTAYELLKDGHQVTVLDRENPAMGGASYGNAGLIAVGHSIAWGSPKAVKTWFNTMINPHPVFRMKLSADPQLISWGLKFLRQCTVEASKRNSLHKHAICAYSQERMQQIVHATNVEYESKRNGLLYLYREPLTFEESIKSTDILKKAGQHLEVVDAEKAKTIMPELKEAKSPITGGIYSPTDESGDSKLFTEELTKVCQAMGGVFETGVTINRLEANGNRIRQVVTNKGVFQADQYVLSLGAWSPLIAKTIGTRLSIFPVKGYSITVPVEEMHTPPSIGGLHEDDFLGFATMGDHFRVSSVSEFAGYDNGHRPEDFEHLLKAAKALFPNAGDYSRAEYWAGFRPMTPEGTPMLGTKRHQNLFYNTGHGHLGWTMACGTARLTADLISGKQPEISCENMKVR